MLEMMSKLQNYYVPVNARHGNTCLYSTVMMITVGRRYISLTGCRSGLDTSLWVASIFLLFRIADIAVHSMSTKGAFSMDTQ